MFSLESPHYGDSNKYTQYTILNIKQKITLNFQKSAAMGRENEPSGFEPLKFYCNSKRRMGCFSFSVFDAF